MDVVAFDPYVAAGRFRELGVEQAASLENLLERSDFLSLHLTLAPETYRLIGHDQLAVAKDGIRIVNAARGELIDEAALLEALQSGKVAGAALDVFSAEPYSGPLLGLDNVVVTPHLAASTEEAQDRAGVIVAEQVAAALEGGVVTNAVNVPAVAAARHQARDARGRARGRDADEARPRLPRRARRPRHAPPHGRSPERRLPGTHRPAGQLRERSLARPGARDRSARGAAPCLAGLHEPRACHCGLERRGDSGRGHDARARRRATARAGPRLRDRDRAGAADAVRRQRRPAGNDRAARDDPRRGGGQHRAHGRLPEPAEREGTHGAHPGQRSPEGFRRSAALRARFRRSSLHRPGTGMSMEWPEPVERVAQFLREALAESRVEEFADGTPTAAAAAEAVGCSLGQIVKSLVFKCNERSLLVLVPGDRRADPAKVSAEAGCQKAKV